MYICVCVSGGCWNIHMSAGATEARSLDTIELELQGFVISLAWILRPELNPFEELHLLFPVEPYLQAPLCFSTYYFANEFPIYLLWLSYSTLFYTPQRKAYTKYRDGDAGDETWPRSWKKNGTLTCLRIYIVEWYAAAKKKK